MNGMFLKVIGTIQYYITLISFLCFSFLAEYGQSQHTDDQQYFQQQVDIKIDVALNDKAHYLTGFWEMHYINHSDDTLDFLYIHLWPNAYRTKTTELAEQLKRLGEVKFHFSDIADNGWIKDLNFMSKGDTLSWRNAGAALDIAIVDLKEVLLPGDTLIMTTPFSLKIPGDFSKLSHIEECYQISHWYPKPAVYDRNGWHPMPYLHQGEFYSEFGKMEVQITLPENYFVAATGVLQNPEEEKRILERAKATAEWKRGEATLTDSFPVSSETLKTLKFVAHNVHDFAWFADKRYLIDQDTIYIEDRPIIARSYYHPSSLKTWDAALSYLIRATTFFSEKVGAYPFSQITIVDGAHERKNSTEYPMVSLIGKGNRYSSLDRVIAHEVGHNWFYGILGFNERVYPWLDEGLTTYYEQSYAARHYEDTLWFLKSFLKVNPKMTYWEGAYLHQNGGNPTAETCPISVHTRKLDYYLSAYIKPAVAFQYLSEYLGISDWDLCMQSFYSDWKFRHPDPSDFKRSFEECTGEDLKWFFDHLICVEQEFDLAIVDSAGYLITRAIGADFLPYPVDFYSGAKLIRRKWFVGTQRFEISSLAGEDIDRIILDPERWLWEKNRKNNSILLGGNNWSNATPFFLRWISGLHDSDSRRLFMLPAIGGNAHNGFQLGMGIHNIGWNMPAFEYYLLPMFALGSNHLVGSADAGYYIFPKNKYFQYWRVGLNFKSFHYRTSPAFDLPFRMARIQPSLKVALSPDRYKEYTQTFMLRSIHLWEEVLTSFDPDQLTTSFQPTWIKEIRYSLSRNSEINPFYWQIALEQQNYETPQRPEHYLKIWSEFIGNYTFAPKANFTMRLFAGTFLWNSHRELGFINPGNGRGNFSLFANGALDYRYDQVFVGRNVSQGIGANQISMSDGGFKNAFTREFDDGITNSYLIAVNLALDLPQLPPWLPIRPYFDGGYTAAFEQRTGVGPLDPNLFWSGGVQLRLLRNLCSVYFPVLNSENIQRFYAERGNYWSRISFSLQFGLQSPGEIVRKLDLPTVFL